MHLRRSAEKDLLFPGKFWLGEAFIWNTLVYSHVWN
uniref:Uncharacterized protein n=1 Tax=Arundo donax TaxID=35708 RepID=A0A0A9B7L2_ARUDO